SAVSPLTSPTSYLTPNHASGPTPYTFVANVPADLPSKFCVPPLGTCTCTCEIVPAPAACGSKLPVVISRSVVSSRLKSARASIDAEPERPVALWIPLSLYFCEFGKDCG